MNKATIVIVSTLLLLACSEGRNSGKSANLNNDCCIEEEPERLDSGAIKILEKTKAETVAPSSGVSNHITSSSGRKNEEPENMRGFDPASEDDMDDNGMSRYMENNDEEGWD